MPDSRRYTIVTKDGRDEFIRKVLSATTHFHGGPVDKATHFSKTVSRLWPGTIWCRIGWWDGRSPWVAKIPTKAGRVIAWRNGSDRGDYNFTVYVVDSKEFHSRPNVKDVVDLIEMLENPKDEALFIGREMGKRNMDYLERMLKHA